MKILPVSFSFSSKNVYPDFEHHFLYTTREFKPNKKRVENFNMWLGLAALVAVGITILNIGANKKAPKNIFMV